MIDLRQWDCIKESIMLSVQPKWVEKIISGEKTIEVRKTAPKLETPFKCFIYCTFPKKPVYTLWLNRGKDTKFLADGKVVGEFTCDNVSEIKPHDDGYGATIEYNKCGKGSCLSSDQLNDYLKGGKGYAWHISDLQIYDKPKKLSEFVTKRKCDSCKVSGYESTACIWDEDCIVPHKLSRAPQSWCYVEIPRL